MKSTRWHWTEPPNVFLAMATAGSWTEQAQRRVCLFPTESPAIRGRDVFTSTNTSMTRRLRCRDVLSSVKSFLTRLSSYSSRELPDGEQWIQTRRYSPPQG